MSLVLSGNSGSLTVDSSAGITFPNGTNPQAAPSKVLQVVQGTTTTGTSTSSSTFVATTLTASITPLFSTSKILVIQNGGDLDNGSTGQQCYATIYRNSTNLGTSAGFATNYNSAGRSTSGFSMCVLDSPATTSSTTYTVYFRTLGATGSIFAQSEEAVLILMEIAA